jgi:hypothetical protein
MSNAAKTNLSGIVENVIVVGDYIPDGYQLCNNWISVGMNINDPEPYIPPVVPTNEEQAEKRKVAYTNESDPIFFKSQRNEATKEEWLNKIAEIDARFPYAA